MPTNVCTNLIANLNVLTLWALFAPNCDTTESRNVEASSAQRVNATECWCRKQDMCANLTLSTIRRYVCSHITITGGFQVEMLRDSQRDRTILCRYDPIETGLYVIHVKWSGVNVPGSPYHCHIVDSQHDLEQVLQGSSFYSGTMASSGYRQWEEDIWAVFMHDGGVTCVWKVAENSSTDQLYTKDV